MNAAEYKGIKDSPDVFSEAELEATVRRLQQTVAARKTIIGAMRTPLPKPPLHQRAPCSDYFRLSLSAESVNEIVDALGIAEVSAVSPEGETTPEASYLADLVDRWCHYLVWLEERTT